MCSVEVKMSKAIRKDGITKWHKTKHPNLGLCKILIELDDNEKNNFEMML
jgi:hypothetical protein